MGSGKSTVGPLVADALGYRFLDLDWLVEARTRRSVAELFAAGEAAFRAAEAEALAETTRGDDLVVALGGGAWLEATNRAVVEAAGVAVWLRVPAPTLAARLDGTAGRPLLAAADGAPLAGDTLAARVTALLAAREPYYALAPLAVDAEALPEAVARRVVEAVTAWTRRSA